MAVKVKQYTFFCLEMFSILKCPCVKLLDKCYFLVGLHDIIYLGICSDFRSLNHCYMHDNKIRVMLCRNY